MSVSRFASPQGGYETTFRADYQCMKCGHKVFGKHPVSLNKCPACGKNSWRRYVREESTSVVAAKTAGKSRLAR